MFSCISGILGVAVIAWYGFADVGESGSGVLATDSNKVEDHALVSSGDENAAGVSPGENGQSDEISPAAGGQR